MDMNWQSWLVLAVIVAILAAIAARGIYNKRRGKSSCSCGGNCGACGMGCGSHKQDEAAAP